MSEYRPRARRSIRMRPLAPALVLAVAASAQAGAPPTFRSARATAGGPAPVTATPLPLDILSADQRWSGAPVDRDADAEDFAPPFRLIALATVHGRRALALFQDTDPDPATAHGNDEPSVIPPWFAEGRPHALGPVTWSAWRGGDRAPPSDVLVIEDAHRAPVAARFVGANRGITPIRLGGAAMFVIEHADTNVDDAIVFEVVGLVDHRLVTLLSVDGGPRSADETRVIEPPGAVTASKGVLHVREVHGAFDTCTPTSYADPGCPGEARDYRWDAAARRLVVVPGSARAVTVRWTHDAARVTGR